MFSLVKSAHAAEVAVGVVALSGSNAFLVMFGVDPGVAMAAAMGAVGLLAFDTRIAARQAVPAILLGMAIGTYGANPVVEYFDRPASWKYIIAVVLGTCGYFLLGGLVKLAERWKTDPVKTAKELKR